MYFNTKEFPMPYGQMKDVLTLVTGRAFIGGGAARSLILNNIKGAYGYNNEIPKPGDIDLFLFAPAWSADVMALLERSGYLNNGDGLPNAETFIKTDGSVFGAVVGLPVQVVTPRILGSVRSGEPKTVLETFAFKTEQFAVELLADGQTAKGTWTEEAVLDTRSKTITINHIDEDPIGMARRMAKYAAKGYEVPRHQVKQLFMRWEIMSDAEKSISYQSFGDY